MRLGQSHAGQSRCGLTSAPAIPCTLVQRVFGFEAAKYGLTDAQATEIACVFSAFDADDNGLLSLDEFQRLCAKYAPELSAAEVKAALGVLDTNKDGSVSLGECPPPPAGPCSPRRRSSLPLRLCA